MKQKPVLMLWWIVVWELHVGNGCSLPSSTLQQKLITSCENITHLQESFWIGHLLSSFTMVNAALHLVLWQMNESFCLSLPV